MKPGIRSQRLKIRRIVLCGILFLTVYCLPAYSSSLRIKLQHVTQTELLFPGSLNLRKSLSYQKALFLQGSLLVYKSFTGDYIRILRYHNVLFKIRMDCLTAQYRSRCHCSNIYSTKFIPQHTDKDFVPAC